MNTLKKWIPNCITLGNLTCGMLACYFAANHWITGLFNLSTAKVSFDWYSILPSLLIFGAAILDFLDGLAARILKVQSELGKQLDSLADMVSFGVAPAIIIMGYDFLGDNLLNASGLLLGIFACIRLAKFNLDTRQSDSFLGLPVPSVGIIIASLPFIDSTGPLSFLTIPWVVLALIVVLCVLMVSEIPLLALKFKTYGLKENIARYSVFAFGLVSLILFQFQGLPFVILGYVFISLLVKEKKGT